MISCDYHISLEPTLTTLLGVLEADTKLCESSEPTAFYNG